MRIRSLVVVLAATMGVLAGCSDSKDIEQMHKDEQRRLSYINARNNAPVLEYQKLQSNEKYVVDNGEIVNDFVLKDGTRCVAMNARSITCNFYNKP